MLCSEGGIPSGWFCLHQGAGHEIDVAESSSHGQDSYLSSIACMKNYFVTISMYFQSFTHTDMSTHMWILVPDLCILTIKTHHTKYVCMYVLDLAQPDDGIPYRTIQHILHHIFRQAFNTLLGPLTLHPSLAIFMAQMAILNSLFHIHRSDFSRINLKQYIHFAGPISILPFICTKPVWSPFSFSFVTLKNQIQQRSKIPLLYASMDLLSLSFSYP